MDLGSRYFGTLANTSRTQVVFYDLFFIFYFLFSHYTYNTLQLYLAGQCQSLPISITKHCHTVYIQIHCLLVLPSLLD